jgi:hypothetical protein
MKMQNLRYTQRVWPIVLRLSPSSGPPACARPGRCGANRPRQADDPGGAGGGGELRGATAPPAWRVRRGAMPPLPQRYPYQHPHPSNKIVTSPNVLTITPVLRQIPPPADTGSFRYRSHRDRSQAARAGRKRDRGGGTPGRRWRPGWQPWWRVRLADQAWWRRRALPQGPQRLLLSTAYYYPSLSS